MRLDHLFSRSYKAVLTSLAVPDGLKLKSSLLMSGAEVIAPAPSSTCCRNSSRDVQRAAVSWRCMAATCTWLAAASDSASCRALGHLWQGASRCLRLRVAQRRCTWLAAASDFWLPAGHCAGLGRQRAAACVREWHSAVDAAIKQAQYRCGRACVLWFHMAKCTRRQYLRNLMKLTSTVGVGVFCPPVLAVHLQLTNTHSLYARQLDMRAKTPGSDTRAKHASQM